MKIEKQLESAGVLNPRILATLKSFTSSRKCYLYGQEILHRKALLQKLDSLCRKKKTKCKYGLSQYLTKLDIIQIWQLQNEINKLAPRPRIKKFKRDKAGVIYLGTGTKGEVLERYLTGKPKRELSQSERARKEAAKEPRPFRREIPSGLPRS